MGPMTGRGLGPCGSGRGFGFGPGYGLQDSCPAYPYRGMTKKEELEALQDESEALNEELEAIKERIGELKAKK
jgi:hypothetical protein